MDSDAVKKAKDASKQAVTEVEKYGTEVIEKVGDYKDKAKEYGSKMIEQFE